jgi:APA family basic amino acid/polyamine antiporter
MSILGKSKRLKKELTLFGIYTIATGSTIASGFFLLPGIAFAQAGPAMVLSYLVAVIPVIPAIFCIAELSTAMPRAGGVYFFLDRSMGPLIGSVGGIGTWFALILKTAFALVGIGAYLGLFFPRIPLQPLAVAFAIVFGIINLFGAKKTGIFQGILVIGLLGIFLGFFSLGIFHLDIQHFKNIFNIPFSSIMGTSGLVYVSYIGLTKIASISEEIKKPDKNIPRAMFFALFTIILVYITGNLLIIGIVPAEHLQNDLTPVATTAKIMLGHWGAAIMTIAALLAFFSVGNAGILSCSRYPLAMSRDHMMPRFLGRLSKNKTPKNSIFLTVLFILLTLIFFDPTKIAKLAGAFQLMLFSLISLAVIIMRESRLASYDPGFRSPLYPWMQIFGMISPLWLIVEMGWFAVLFTLGLIAAGIIWYIYFSKGTLGRDSAIYYVFARLSQRRIEGLDIELRSILKEKGVRDYDPYDAVISNAYFIDISSKISFEQIVTRCSKYLSKKVHIDWKILKKSFMDGTQVGATPVAKGAALPHLRLPGINFSELIIVRSQKGVKVEIDCEYIEKEMICEPVYAFFFLVSSDKNPSQHLRILAQIARHVDQDHFLKNWISSKNEQQLKEVLIQEERYLSMVLKSNTKTESLINAQIKSLELPGESLITMIHRGKEIIIPHGKTILKENDRLTIIGNQTGIQELKDKYQDYY